MDSFKHYEQAIEQVLAMEYQTRAARQQELLDIESLCLMSLFTSVCGVAGMQSVWVKKGTMQWWRDWKPHKWIDVHFALEQFSGPDGNKDGILFINYNFYEEKKVGSTLCGFDRHNWGSFMSLLRGGNSGFDSDGDLSRWDESFKLIVLLLL